MLRTLILLVIAISVCGCQYHQADLDLPANIQRIKVEPIESKTTVYGQQLTDLLKHELAKDFIITDENPDLIISGSAMPTDSETIGSAVFTFRTQTKKVGIISFVGSSLGDRGMEIAKKIKKILTKRR